MSEREDPPINAPEPQSQETPASGAATPVEEPSLLHGVGDEPLPDDSTEPSADDKAETTAAQTAQEATPEPTSDDLPAEDPAQRAAAQQAADEAVFAASRRQTRRSFVAAAAGAAAGYGFYHWVANSPGNEMQPSPLRRAFDINAAISRGISRDRALAPTYALKDARDLRVNGVYGLKQALLPESWRLQLVGSHAGTTHPRYTPDVTAWEYRYTDAGSHEDQGHDTKVDPNARSAEKMAPAEMMEQAKAQENRVGRMPRGREEAGESRSTLMPQTPGLLLTVADLVALPRHELVTQFKCIEGWSQIVHWAGVRMADFMEAYPPQPVDGEPPKYVYMETPDGDYYTGYDMEVCRHPQTLLVTEMMGSPLTQFHGAPLRLHMPTKYGYKQIKRIALIAYTNQKPDDYWTKLGYDWYAGL
jgi:hypothetical protein